MSYSRCLFLALLGLLACRAEGPPASTAPATSTPITRTSGHSDAPKERQPPPDTSLTADAYIQLGMPAHDRSWSGGDMAKAAHVLAGIGEKNAGHIPRYESKRSGPVFARITADDNLEFYRNHSLPIDTRMGDSLNYMQSLSQILRLYLAAHTQRGASDSELVELIGANLRFVVVMFQLTSEFFSNLDKNDDTYAVRLDGLQKMKNGIAISVSGALDTLTESHIYRTSELRRLVGYLQETLPDILPGIPSGSRAEVLVRVRSFVHDPAMKHLRPELTALHAAIKKPADSKETP